MVKRLTPKLDKLLRRVRAAVKQRGARAQLAAELEVIPPTLSNWLNGRYEPGGEATLQLQKWVIEAEAKQQNKEPGRALTRPGRMTRRSKITSHEKAKSDQRKS